MSKTKQIQTGATEASRKQQYAIKSIRTGRFYSTATGKFTNVPRAFPWEIAVSDFINDKRIISARQAGELILAPVLA